MHWLPSPALLCSEKLPRSLHYVILNGRNLNQVFRDRARNWIKTYHQENKCQDTDWRKDSHDTYLKKGFMSSLYNEFLENIRKGKLPPKPGTRFVQLFQKRFAKNDRHVKTYQSLLIWESKLKYTSVAKIKIC